MTFKHIGMGLVVWILLGASPPNPASLQGIVFEDINGNGAREPGEPGIAGVVVSNQIDCVATGADGSFRLDPNRGYGIVFVRVPATYRTVGRFWIRIPSDSD